MKVIPKGLAAQLIFLILASTAIIFLAAFIYNLTASKKAVMQQVEANARHLTLETTYRVEAVLQAVEKVPVNLAVVLENYPFRQQNLLRLIRTTVETNRDVYGIAVAFEPHAFDPQRYYFSP
jgi:sigma-B regulation protein RsbU (phosphoserine phosphatase)